MEVIEYGSIGGRFLRLGLNLLLLCGYEPGLLFSIFMNMMLLNMVQFYIYIYVLFFFNFDQHIFIWIRHVLLKINWWRRSANNLMPFLFVFGEWYCYLWRRGFPFLATRTAGLTAWEFKYWLFIFFKWELIQCDPSCTAPGIFSSVAARSHGLVLSNKNMSSVVTR